MSDIKCVVCGEPWDAYGVSHGDMARWEARLFRAGAGCPTCEGTPPDGKQWEPSSIFDVENGDEDEGERIAAHEDFAEGKAPKWERPADPVLWTCDGCGVQVVRDLDNEGCKGERGDDLSLGFKLPLGAKGQKWYGSHNYRDDKADETPAHTFKDGRKVCPYCLDSCADCGGAISSILEFDDCYDDGYSFLPEGCYLRSEGVCSSCYENRCSECGAHYDECTCIDPCGDPSCPRPSCKE